MKNLRILVFVCFALAAIPATSLGQAPKSHWAKYDGGRLHFYDIGKSSTKAIIFVHGWTCNADFWKDSYQAFPKYRVMALDLPGHGQSDKPMTNYSMEYFARSIDAVMKATKIKQAVLVGHSMGTPIIRQFYRIFPQETLALVAVDGPLQPFGPKEQMARFFGPLLANPKEERPKFVDGLLGSVRADLRPSIRSVMLSAPDRVAVSAMKGMLDDAIWTNDTINVPVLAVMAKGPLFSGNIEEGYRTIAPKLEFHMWEDVSHFLMMEKPKEFNETVMEFVAKNKLL